jgi:hypothetical protein
MNYFLLIFSNLNTALPLKTKNLIFLYLLAFFTGVTSIVKYAPSSYGAGNQNG